MTEFLKKVKTWVADFAVTSTGLFIAALGGLGLFQYVLPAGIVFLGNMALIVAGLAIFILRIQGKFSE